MKKAFLLFVGLCCSVAIVAQISITPLYAVKSVRLKEQVFTKYVELSEVGIAPKTYSTFSLDLEVPIFEQWSLVVPVAYQNRSFDLGGYYYDDIRLESLNRKMYETGIMMRWRPSKYVFAGGGLALEYEKSTTYHGVISGCFGNYGNMTETISGSIEKGAELQAGVEWYRFTLQARYRHFFSQLERAFFNANTISVMSVEVGYRLVLGNKNKQNRKRKDKRQKCPKF